MRCNALRISPTSPLSMSETMPLTSCSPARWRASSASLQWGLVRRIDRRQPLQLRRALAFEAGQPGSQQVDQHDTLIVRTRSSRWHRSDSKLGVCKNDSVRTIQRLCGTRPTRVVNSG